MKKTNRELYKLYYCMRESVEQNLVYAATVTWCQKTIELDTKRYLVTVADACIQMYVINWCKIFGAERNNPIHWKKYGIAEEDFFQKLQKDCGITKVDFDCCREAMMDFRNKYVAHTGDFDGVVPFLRISKDALVILDAMLIDSDDELFGMLKDYIEPSADNYNEISKRVIGK